jgi:hypothetical protein
MIRGDAVYVSALAINVMVPDMLRCADTRGGEEFTLTTLNLRLLVDGRPAANAYGQPTNGGRGRNVSFPVPDSPDLVALAGEAAAGRCVLGRYRGRG